ncbi:MAG: hypothetical protein M1825_001067 [Sarcosagium campestre]|nr:MAG: hypothetical protein M1825_001067 [Sarcosagium campestre]
MASPTDIQDLLRFLSQDAKVPLSTAIGKIKDLQKASMNSPDAISRIKLPLLLPIFPDEKIAKQILSAAKRVSKKRAAPGSDSTESPSKKARGSSESDPLSPAAIEQSLKLPEPVFEEAEISRTELITNRAPLVLAFAVCLLKYTMPQQPLSSRLSLAQAVVSVNSRSKAVSLGLQSGKSAEDEGWGRGQRAVKIMGREIQVMTRSGYDWNENAQASDSVQGDESSDAIGSNNGNAQDAIEPALWGLDLEMLRSSNGPMINNQASRDRGLPIYNAKSARDYLLKSFASKTKAEDSSTPAKRKSAANTTMEKEHNLAILLGALDLLFQSWVKVLESAELDRRAWQWYVNVRPDVEPGVSGWGAKGTLRTGDILKLRRSVE